MVGTPTNISRKRLETGFYWRISIVFKSTYISHNFNSIENRMLIYIQTYLGQLVKVKYIIELF